MSIVISEGENGQWFVQIKTSGGRVITGVGEGYRTERDARAAAGRLRSGMHRARVVVR